MFTNNNHPAKKHTPSSAAINMIGDGTTITCDIKSKGDIRVDGSLKGSIETEGKVVVGQGGVVEGDVICKDADVAGVLKAKISNIISKLCREGHLMKKDNALFINTPC